LSLSNRGCERFEKKFYNGGNNILEGLRSVDQFGFPDETLPLNILFPNRPISIVGRDAGPHYAENIRAPLRMNLSAWRFAYSSLLAS